MESSLLSSLLSFSRDIVFCIDLSSCPLHILFHHNISFLESANQAKVRLPVHCCLSHLVYWRSSKKSPKSMQQHSWCVHEARQMRGFNTRVLTLHISGSCQTGSSKLWGCILLLWSIQSTYNKNAYGCVCILWDVHSHTVELQPLAWAVIVKLDTYLVVGLYLLVASLLADVADLAKLSKAVSPPELADVR